LELTRREWVRLAAETATFGAFGLHGRFVMAQGDASVPFQPFRAATERLLQALSSLGTPLALANESRIRRALSASVGAQEAAAVNEIQTTLDSNVLINVEINPEMRVSVTRGSAPAELIQGGWRTFLVRVKNAAGNTPVLTIKSPQGGAMGRRSSGAITGVHDFTNGAVDEVEARSRWLGITTVNSPPMTPALTGLELEYRIVQLYSRDNGQREATLQADCGWGEQDLGYRSSLPILFRCTPAHAVALDLRDENEQPAVCSLLVKDSLGRIYPSQSKRTMPDLSFQPQVYRYSGEFLLLPEGHYVVEAGHGPEYLKLAQSLTVDRSGQSLKVALQRWIDPAQSGYYSGDTHVHAAGCSHYESPSEGVTPLVMKRQADGEALDLASVLNWAPGFEYQKQFFTGHTLSTAPAQNMAAPVPDGMPHDSSAIATEQDAEIMDTVQHDAASPALSSLVRYDVETSGFPCSHCGHLVLLRLRDDIYPGTHSVDDWPSWNVPILRWAKQQGALVGYAHSGHGLMVDSTELPNLLIPPFNSMGANEFIADVTQPGLVDFISGCDLWPFAELNIWYHTMNCGFDTAFAGETDFPCLTDACVGGGRSYVRLPTHPHGDQGYSDWIDSLLHGSSYFGDGRSHLLNFQVSGAERSSSSPQLRSAGQVEVSANIAARLEPVPTDDTRTIQHASPYEKPYWHIERARVRETRNVPVELVVNGIVVDRTEILGDGAVRPVRFHTDIRQSSWIALRIYPSSHTNPIVVKVGDRPVRASRASAEWCRRGVDVCWEQKKQRIRPQELAAAFQIYEHARRTYDDILRELA
jgi:hypothetical protein